MLAAVLLAAIHSDADPIVPYGHAVRLHEALGKAGRIGW